MKKRVVVAMSGGVDSSTAAWLLRDQGYDVLGATMCIGKTDRTQDGPARCCGLSDIEDARRVAIQIGIPFHVFHLEEEFDREVIQYFCGEYSRGRTPNPCILCNEKLKFGYFLRKARELGADFIATGHYVRLGFDEEFERYFVKKGVDQKKDQSYVLFSLSQNQLRYALFPLGEWTKTEVRKKAHQLDLTVHDKPESQEVCFIQESSYHSFLLERLKTRVEPGPMVDRKGHILGKHKGIPFYTIGQRRGLRLAKGKPFYVVGIDLEKNAVIVGEEEELYAETFFADSINWILPSKANISEKVYVKIRYNHPGAEAQLFPRANGNLEVRFKTPQKAVTPGQAAVFYHDDIVIGGGWIKEVKGIEGRV